MKSTCNYNYLNNNDIDDIIYNFHANIMDADEYIQSKKKSTHFKYSVKKVNHVSSIPFPDGMDSHFFPKYIKTYIENNATYVLEFNSNINSRDINVFFIVFNEITPEHMYQYNRYIHSIYMWIYILNLYSSNKCSNILDLYLYFTPFKKILPNNQLITLSTDHVNTAYTTSCQKNSEIVLFRKEEWFKVFIHETFHNFGLDFSEMNMYHVNSQLSHIFNISKIEYNLYESYCETWARIFNVMFSTYYNIPEKLKKNHIEFASAFKINMFKECHHSLFQKSKILHFMDLNFNIVTNKRKKEYIDICNHLYSEDTSVFSYYVITGLLVNNYINFILWCKKNNTIILQFKKTPSNITNYINFIEKTLKKKNIKNNIEKVEKYIDENSIDQSLTMTVYKI